MPRSRVVVSAGSRLHFGLLDLCRATPMCYGGAGMMLASPEVVVEAAVAPRSAIDGLEQLDVAGQADVRSLVRRASRRWSAPPIAIRIKSMPPQHAGFGTKTALLLSVATGISTLLERRVDPATLHALTRRGGASGIGSHGFFLGGYLVDAGHPQALVRKVRPSSARPTQQPPCLVHRSRFPDSWVILLFHTGAKSLTKPREHALFRAASRLPASTALRSLALVHHGVSPAVIRADLGQLRESLNDLQSCSLKGLELGAQDQATRGLARALAALPHGAAGLSSLGPTLFLIVEAEDLSTQRKARRIAENHGARVFGPVHGRNQGRTVDSV